MPGHASCPFWSLPFPFFFKGGGGLNLVYFDKESSQHLPERERERLKVDGYKSIGHEQYDNTRPGNDYMDRMPLDDAQN